MPSYAAFLGHQPHISIAELSATITDFDLQEILQSQVVLFSSNLNLDAEYLRTLGGTIAIARKVSDDDRPLSDVPSILEKEVAGVKGKVTFSLRAFGLPTATVKQLYRDCKNHLKKLRKPARYVGSESRPAASVLLRDEGLLDGSHGCELILIKTDVTSDKYWIGKTVAAQDVDAYSKRDMQKPVRDTRMGLLPPKLAQILLNFGAWLAHGTAGGSGKKQLTILDPFCGTGVIPMECLLRRWHALASDSSQKAANGCEKNLDWLRKEEKILKKEVESTVWRQDARKPFTLKELPDAIVTETTLGPPLDSKPSLKDISKMKTENEVLQEEFLRNAAATLPGVSIACMWPVWYGSKGQIRLERVWERLHEIGYRVAIPAAVDIDITGRPTLVYRRPGQFVGREIVLLQAMKKK